jgi:7-cyano-7-deazaguanine synthase
MKLLKVKNIKRKIAVCTLSGGLDSAVATALIKKAGFDIRLLFFDWGQKNFSRELKCVNALSKYFNAPLTIVEIPLIKMLPNIGLTQKGTVTTGNAEYVPNRNAVLETQAIAFAESIGAGLVSVGSNAGDLSTPDGSKEFIKRMQSLIDQGTLLKPSIQLIAPLIETDKIGAVKIGLKLGVPFEYTWSCNNFTEKACGKCTNCLPRLEAFKGNNREDAIYYV